MTIIDHVRKFLQTDDEYVQSTKLAEQEYQMFTGTGRIYFKDKSNNYYKVVVRPLNSLTTVIAYRVNHKDLNNKDIFVYEEALFDRVVIPDINKYEYAVNMLDKSIRSRLILIDRTIDPIVRLHESKVADNRIIDKRM